MDLLQERNAWNLRKSTESNHPFDDDTVSFSEEVKLTLSFGGYTGKEGINNSTWHEKITQSTSHHVINLEESANLASCTDSESLSTPCCAALITKDKHNLRVPVESNHVSRKTSMKKDLSSGLTLSCSTVDSSESCEGQDSFNQGLIYSNASSIKMYNCVVQNAKKDYAWLLIKLCFCFVLLSRIKRTKC